MTEKTTKDSAPEEWLIVVTALVATGTLWLVLNTYKPIVLYLVATFPSLHWLLPGN